MKARRTGGKPVLPKVKFPCLLCGQLGHKWSVTSWPRGKWVCGKCFRDRVIMGGEWL